MLGSDERRAAAELARALDGDPQAVTEARRLAQLLQGAAGAARIDVPDEEVEQALERTRFASGEQRRRRPRRSVLKVAAAAAVTAVAVVVLLPLLRSSPGVDVEARAAGAVDRLGVLHAVSQISSPGGALSPGGLTTWIDHRRGHERVRLSRTDQAGVVDADVLSTPAGYVRYQPGTNTAVAGPSCAVVASGCAELLDPVELYRRALLAAGIDHALRVTAGGRDAYRFRLPLPGSAGRPGVTQVVTIDADTFLPITIEWRDRTGTVAVIRTMVVEQVAPDALPSQLFQLPLPANAHVRQVTADGRDVRVLGRRVVSPAQLRRSGLAAGWLGMDVEGQPLQRIEVVRFTGGDAVLFRYAGLHVWSYDVVIPPELRAGHLSPTKILSDGPSPVHFYVTAGGHSAAERDLSDLTVAVVFDPRYGKLDVVRALGRATRFR
jgi:hypothetical protein